MIYEFWRNLSSLQIFEAFPEELQTAIWESTIFWEGKLCFLSPALPTFCP